MIGLYKCWCVRKVLAYTKVLGDRTMRTFSHDVGFVPFICFTTLWRNFFIGTSTSGPEGIFTHLARCYVVFPSSLKPRPSPLLSLPNNGEVYFTVQRTAYHKSPLFNLSQYYSTKHILPQHPRHRVVYIDQPYASFVAAWRCQFFYCDTRNIPLSKRDDSATCVVSAQRVEIKWSLVSSTDGIRPYASNIMSSVAASKLLDMRWRVTSPIA